MASPTAAGIDSPSKLPPLSSSQVESPKLQEFCHSKKHPTAIRVPDMFSSILSAKAAVNPHYLAVKEEGDRFIGEYAIFSDPRIHRKSTESGEGNLQELEGTRLRPLLTSTITEPSLMGWDDQARKKNSQVDFAYLVATWSPETDSESLRVMLDWCHWVFPFDDQVDEGHLKEDFSAAQAEMTAYAAIVDGTARRYTADTEEPTLKLRYLFQTCCDRIRARSKPEMIRRFQEQHQRYFAGLLYQVDQQASGKALNRSTDDYIKMRRCTIGAYPAIALSEWSEGIELASGPFKHPSLQQCMTITADLVWLGNDIISFRKDLKLGVDHNLISLLMEQGHGMQEAVDKMGDMINDCYRCWYLALAELPVWGEAMDREALRFINVCRNLALGNLHWNFKTGRYLGVEGDELRRTRVMHLPPQEPDQTVGA